MDPIEFAEAMIAMTDPMTDPTPKTAEDHYQELFNEIRALHGKKGQDYGTQNDAFANLRAAERFGFPAWVGVLLRMEDKMSRLTAFVKNGDLANESAEDSFLDLANYAMLGLALLREETYLGKRSLNSVDGDCNRGTSTGHYDGEGARRVPH